MIVVDRPAALRGCGAIRNYATVVYKSLCSTPSSGSELNVHIQCNKWDYSHEDKRSPLNGHQYVGAMKTGCSRWIPQME